MTARSLSPLAALTVALFSGTFARAQTTAQDVFPIDPKTLIEKLWGNDAAFSAEARISGKGKDPRNNFEMRVQYALLQGRLRTEMELTEGIDEKSLTAQQYRVREIRLDHVIHIALPDLKLKYFVYPKVKAYCELPMQYPELTHTLDNFQKIKLAEETLDGHPCVKYAVKATNEFLEDVRAVVWQATDLKNFPLQLQFDVGEEVFTMSFRNVKLTPPDLLSFQPPQEFTRYTDQQELARDAARAAH